MDYEGHLRDLGEDGILELNEMMVEMKDATDKQRECKKVSTKDNRSVLGKKLQAHRKKNKASKKSRKANRNK